MKEFQIVGGLLDGILAVVHPDLYQSAIALMAQLYADHTASRAVIAEWPSCYSAVQIIANRIHELPFTFCICPNADREDLQLLDLGYYPASKSRPKTVFTTRVLDDFLLANKECKTPARNYYNKLRRMSNSAFPHMVPDRYKELLRVSRQWRNQQMRLSAGFGHRAQTVGPGDLAILCPACPQPGQNLPEDWQDDPDSWKFTRSVVLDGNFSAQHKHMRNPEDDVALADGHAFMVTDGPYKEHLRTAREFKEKSTCHEHRAVLTATMERAKFEATGIGAAACSRHGFFAPHACVDFQQGERQRNMDYVLNWILAWLNGLTCILVLYDIMCQYFTHLRARFEQSPFLTMPVGLTIQRGIGQFHVHGHVAQCFARFSTNFISGAGMQDGEIIETLWNQTNAIADSTKGMSSAHRREVIDDHMNDSNWKKLTKITNILIGKWKRATREHGPAVEAFEDLCKATDADLREEWQAAADEADAARDGDPTAMDIYDVSAQPLPSRKEIQLMLAEQELAHEAPVDGVADWIAQGLRLEETKLAVAYSARRLKAVGATQTRLSLVQQRQKLRKDIGVFNKESATHLGLQGSPEFLPESVDLGSLGAEWDSFAATDNPATGDVETGVDEGPDFSQPERLALILPSTLGPDFLRRHDLLHLACTERLLREGQMNDALQAIRTGIGYKSLLYRTKVRHAPTYRAKLRSFDDTHIADEGVRKHVRIYTQARAAMEKLFDPADGGDTELRTRFRENYKEIKKDDLRATTAVLESFTPGLRNIHAAWFWNIADTSIGADSQWMKESRLDHAGFLASARALLKEPIRGGDEWGFPKWWTWNVAPSEGGKEMPGWWNAPTADVGPPMPLFESDRADIEAVSGRAYKILGELLFQKECKLQGIEGRITEFQLRLSD
ncbi:hypothetical protein GSI_11585 [Ganoderma sinense ZZ0214-1]|uniref:CxC2-like cysteine cluster KDZ transposase-associated domain-containing protein n=1 Tax=Ganoderma sinense ZZ0214-1 TaxID=1077348 RepID=A0A2G8RWE5_9APHY|nr:hypothetical protein GSI_11585 [Ganoderma sinense ZZ0214-1]